MQDYFAAKTILLNEIIQKAGKKAADHIRHLSLLHAVGGYIGQDLQAQVDSPAFDNSAMDGYAICDPNHNTLYFDIIARVAAGDDHSSISLRSGQACRIFTGAAIPKGTTSVVMQEMATVMGTQLILNAIAPMYHHIRYQGEELKVGQLLAAKGHYIDPALIALLASQGYAELPVMTSLKTSEVSVSIFSTGNELLEPGLPLTQGKIYDANRYQLMAWLKIMQVKVTDGHILPDHLLATKNALIKASCDTDIIIVSGGASVGEADYVKSALEEIGTLKAWKLAIKPGKPFGWGKIIRPDQTTCHVFILPGNPVAAYVTFYLLVYPAILKMQGLPHLLTEKSVIADFEITKIETRREFLRGKLTQNQMGLEMVQALQGQGSAMLFSLSQADVLIEIPPNTLVQRGNFVKVIRLPKS